MRRIFPQHFTRRGPAKKPYETREDAMVVAERYNQDVYRCKFCGKYHTARKRNG